MGQNVNMGENGPLLLFKKIFNNISLFIKYLAIYHSFKTQIQESRVLHITQVLKNQVT